MSNDNRRKIILINKPFQIKMILKFIALNILLMAMFSIMIYIFTNSEIESNLNRAHITFTNVKDMLMPLVLTLSAINIILSSIIITGFVLFASFRIAGPLYRFNAIIEDLGNRKFNTITSLRKDDQLYQCSVSLHDTVSSLKDDMTAIKNSIEDIERLTVKTLTGDAGEKINTMKKIIEKYQLK